jgi:tetratricopeptide (TPR) repeat protein
LAKLSVEQALSKAKSHKKKGELAEAQALYATILKAFPNNKKAQQGLTTLGGGQLSAAEQGPPQAVIDQLVSLFNQGQSELVIEQAKNLTIQYPASFILWNILGVANKSLGKVAEATKAFINVTQYNSNFAEGFSNLGVALGDQGQLDDAMRAHKRAIKLKPVFFEAYNNMGTVLRKLGNLDECISSYKKAITLKPDYIEAHNNLGVALAEKGNLREAIASYQQVISLKPDYAEAYNNMGVALKDQDKLEEAIQAFAKALAIKPDYAEAYYNIGNARKEQGKLEEAIQSFAKALAIKPNYTEAYNNMGTALKKQGMLEDAIEAYNKALALKPDQANATENRLNLLIQLQGTALTRNEKLKQIIEDKQTDITWRPKPHIFHAISSFLSADENQAHRHIYNFKTCNSKLLDDLNPKDQVFCSAYSNYLSALLQKPLGEASGLGNSNLVYHIGESHCLSYAHRNIKINGATSRIAPMITFGAKAFHFSKATDSAFKAITKANLDSIPKGSQVFVSFGEIDCRPDEGFISAATKLDQSVEDIIANTVTGYLQWFAQHNKAWNHNMHFLNVPAPEYDQTFDAKVNGDVANIVALFNHKIKEQIAQYNFNMIDVFGFTLGKNGFSNSHFHIDAKHLGAKAIPEIEHQLNS